MRTISKAQVKAARALLGWSQDQLAEAAQVSVTTIRNLESGEMSVRNVTMAIVQVVLEKAGIEFTAGEGVRRRNLEVKIYSCDELFDDMLRTVCDKSGEVISMFTSPGILTGVCEFKAGKLGRLEEICRHTSIKCLIGEPFNSQTPLPASSAFRYRTILKQHIGHASYFVYGSKQAMVLLEGTNVRFFVLDSFATILDFRKYFIAMWDAAPPVYETIKHPDQPDHFLPLQ